MGCWADPAMRPGAMVSIAGADLRRDGNRHHVRVRGKTGERVPVTAEMFTRLRGLVHGDAPLLVPAQVSAHRGT